MGYFMLCYSQVTYFYQCTTLMINAGWGGINPAAINPT